MGTNSSCTDGLGSDVGGNIHYHTAAGLVTDPGWRDSPNLAPLPLTPSSLASVHLAKASPCTLCNGARKTIISIPHSFICARIKDAKYTYESPTLYYTHHFSALAPCELYLLDLISPLAFDMFLCCYHHFPSLWKRSRYTGRCRSAEKKPELQSSGGF